MYYVVLNVQSLINDELSSLLYTISIIPKGHHVDKHVMESTLKE
jgi:hypothetical protein